MPEHPDIPPRDPEPPSLKKPWTGKVRVRFSQEFFITLDDHCYCEADAKVIVADWSPATMSMMRPSDFEFEPDTKDPNA